MPLWTVALQAPLFMDFLGKNTGVGCHFFLQGTFPAQGLNPGFLHCRQILYWMNIRKFTVQVLLKPGLENFEPAARY